jgi:pyridoxine 4-dehydrogenase
MMMTWKPTSVPDEDAFAAIKAGIDTLSPGVKMLLNSGKWALIRYHRCLVRTHTRCFTVAEFYGQGLTVANLELVARFFEKYPEYADRAFLSVKGGLVPGSVNVDGSRENLRRSVDNVLKALRGTKKLDLFEPARRDAKYEVEHYMEVLNEMVKEGKFDYIGLSEVRAETVRRAHKVRTKPFSSIRSCQIPDMHVGSYCAKLGCACRSGGD